MQIDRNYIYVLMIPMCFKKIKYIKFSEQEIQALFGPEAAKDEDPSRLREYYALVCTEVRPHTIWGCPKSKIRNCKETKLKITVL